LINKKIPKILCVIPARKGSKGLKNKNTKKLHNHPLIGWTIMVAKKCKNISDIIVSTDSLNIAKISRKYGAKVPFIRPKKFATDRASTFSVLKHALDHYKSKEIEYDYLLLLEPTSPLRDFRDINFCLNKIMSKNIDTIVSVSKVKAQHPNFLFYINKKNRLKPYLKNFTNSSLRRQDVNPLYFLEGSIYISKISTLLKKRTFYHDKTQAHIVKSWRSLEIDNLNDFKLAKYYIKKK